MTWVLAVAVAWLVVAAGIGVLVGRGIRLADTKDAQTTAAEAASPNFVVDPGHFAGVAAAEPVGRPASIRPPVPRPASEPTSSDREPGLA